jgi:hypothetical protein
MKHDHRAGRRPDHRAERRPDPRPDHRTRAVRVGAAADGTMTYLVDLAPEALPPVRQRDLAAAWEAARARAIAAGDDAGGSGAAGWDVARLFRFRRADGTHTDLALADQDACCWAGAVDGTVGMETSYGLSLCLRLLALVDLLARARWAAGFLALRPEGAEIDPSVLRAAAHAPLTAEARFDESGFRAQVLSLGLPAPICPGASA